MRIIVFPEMRAQLRTYHPIPSLQTYADQSAYKQLQDAPRLKSILKGACDDRPEPSTFDQLIMQQRLPRTNPINLVFILATYGSRVTEAFFTPPNEFFDLITNTQISSLSRAKVFLWIMWVYLESDFSPESVQSNPFGLGHAGGAKVPEMVKLPDGEVEIENVDSEEEKRFAERMMEERRRHLENSLTPQASGKERSDGKDKKRKKRKDKDRWSGKDTEDGGRKCYNQGITVSFFFNLR